MSTAIIIFTVTLILLLLFTSKITANIEKGEEFKISFDFSLFTLIFTQDAENSKRKTLKKELLNPIFKAVLYLLEKSKVDVRRLRIFGTEGLTRGSGHLLSFIGISSLLSYVASCSKSFNISDDAYLITPPFTNEELLPYIVLSVNFSITSLFISLIIFVYYLIRNSFLKKVKNAG